MYRVTVVVVDLVCVDLDFKSSLAGWLLLKLPTALAGWWNIPYQVNPSQVRSATTTVTLYREETDTCSVSPFRIPFPSLLQIVI